MPPETPARPEESTTRARPPAVSKKPRRGISRRRRLIYISIPTILFILLLGVLELIARLALPPITRLETFVRLTFPNLISEKDGSLVFDGDPLLGWRFKSNLKNIYWDFTTFSTNRQGLRHPGPVGSKSDKGFRVVCLGDSVTFGFRVPVAFPKAPMRFNPNHKPFPRLLEDRLQMMPGHRRDEVVTWAVPGYTSHQGLAWLRRDLGRYDPDMVIICYGWNDIDIRTAADRDTLPMGLFARSRRRLLGASRAFLAATRWIESKRIAQQTSGAPKFIPRVSESDYVANFTAMAGLCRRHGAQPIVLAPFYRDAVTNQLQAQRIAAWRQSLARAMQEQGVPYLEITELTEAGHPGNARLFGELIHPNHIGHRLIAERLIQFIDDRDLLNP